MKKVFIIIIVSFFLYDCIIMEPEGPRSSMEYPEVPEAPAKPPIYYSQYGATGDGKTDDFDAIIATHNAANKTGQKVMADPGKTYYIGATNRTAFIKTDTDWGDARFIIDDTKVEKRGLEWEQSWLFMVQSLQKSFPVYSISGLKKGQTKVSLNLNRRVLINVIDNTTRIYIRRGMNENSGAVQRDVFIVEKDGTVAPEAPILWDFNNISSVTAYPIDEYQLKITGGRFTTIANRGSDKDAYIDRGIRILRSNTLVDGFYHDVVGGDDLPIAAYNGIIAVGSFVADVTIQNSVFTGRRVMNNKGTYDISVISVS